MATCYILRKLNNQADHMVLDYVDSSMHQVRTFASPREAYLYGLKKYGKDQFITVETKDAAYITFEMKDTQV